jgi:hypothetical protein
LSSVVLLSFTVILAIFIKYTAYIILPMIAAPLATLIFVKTDIPRSRSVTSLFIALLPPILLLCSYMAVNYKNYGRPLPWNDQFINTSIVHPRDPGGVNFFSFSPWHYIKEPIVMPGQMQSFWTMIYSSTWIDSEPKFTYYTDRNDAWWLRYYSWLRGETDFPSTPPPISTSTRILTTGLLVCGFVPLGLAIIGSIRCILFTVKKNYFKLYNAIKLQAFPIMLTFNAAGIIILAVKAPVYSSLKSSYFLNSMPAFSVFTAQGIQLLENKKFIRFLIIFSTCIYIIFSTLSVLRISLAITQL